MITLDIPLWPEIKLATSWEHASRIIGFLAMMPNEWTTSRKIERAYFWAVFCTLAPKFVENLILECRELRHKARMEKKKQPDISFISESMASGLLRYDFVSSKF